MTCCAVHLDLSGGRLAYVNAGAPMPLVLPAATRLQSLEHPSLVLGTDADYAYEATTIDLPPDFRVVLYTDGVADACNAAGEPYGHERLKSVLLERSSFGRPSEMIGIVTRSFQEHLAGHPHDDDVLVMVLGR